jgi:tryptophan-rich sensory protein
MVVGMAKKRRSDIPFLKLISLAFVLEVIGAIITWILTNSDRTWYNALITPTFSAPTWLSSEIWAVLYLFMMMALFFAYENKGKRNLESVYVMFFLVVVLPLVKNLVLWQMQALVASIIIQLVLLLFALFLTLDFWRISRKAGLFMLPVLAWVMYSMAVGIVLLTLNGFI